MTFGFPVIEDRVEYFLPLLLMVTISAFWGDIVFPSEWAKGSVIRMTSLLLRQTDEWPNQVISIEQSFL